MNNKVRSLGTHSLSQWKWARGAHYKFQTPKVKGATVNIFSETKRFIVILKKEIILLVLVAPLNVIFCIAMQCIISQANVRIVMLDPDIRKKMRKLTPILQS